MVPDILSQEPRLAWLWAIYGGMGLAGFLLCRYRFWLVYLTAPVCLIMTLPMWMELYDPLVSHLLWHVSPLYYLESHLALAAALLLPFAGAWQSVRARRKVPLTMAKGRVATFAD